MTVKTYEACPKKRKARLETIISPYRKYFGYCLPENKQYWTMCATHYNAKKQLLKGSELDQMVESDLIKLKQFHGVDIVCEIIKGNREAVPDAHWHCGDFYKTMVAARNKGLFNPAVVNCDHLKMPYEGAEYLAKIMAFLSDIDDVMFVGNLILRTRMYFSSAEEMLKMLLQCQQFKYAYDQGWKFDNHVYVYNGTGKDLTVLGSVVFYRGGMKPC